MRVGLEIEIEGNAKYNRMYMLAIHSLCDIAQSCEGVTSHMYTHSLCDIIQMCEGVTSHMYTHSLCDMTHSHK